MDADLNGLNDTSYNGDIIYFLSFILCKYNGNVNVDTFFIIPIVLCLLHLTFSLIPILFLLVFVFTILKVSMRSNMEELNNSLDNIGNIDILGDSNSR